MKLRKCEQCGALYSEEEEGIGTESEFPGRLIYNCFACWRKMCLAVPITEGKVRRMEERTILSKLRESDMAIKPDNLIADLRAAAISGAEARRVAEYGPGGGNPNAKPEDHIEWAAADEIESLRAEVERLKAEPNAATWRGEIQRLENAIERLLVITIEANPRSQGPWMGYRACSHYAKTCSDRMGILCPHERCDK